MSYRWNPFNHELKVWNSTRTKIWGPCFPPDLRQWPILCNAFTFKRSTPNNQKHMKEKQLYLYSSASLKAWSGTKSNICTLLFEQWWSTHALSDMMCTKQHRSPERLLQLSRHTNIFSGAITLQWATLGSICFHSPKIKIRSLFSGQRGYLCSTYLLHQR